MSPITTRSPAQPGTRQEVLSLHEGDAVCGCYEGENLTPPYRCRDARRLLDHSATPDRLQAEAALIAVEGAAGVLWDAAHSLKPFADADPCESILHAAQQNRSLTGITDKTGELAEDLQRIVKELRTMLEERV